MATLSFHRLKMGKVEIVCLFVLMLNVTVNNYSIMSGGSHCFLGITSALNAFYISFYVNCVSVPHSFVKSRKIGYYFMYIFRYKNAWKKSNGGAK